MQKRLKKFWIITTDENGKPVTYETLAKSVSDVKYGIKMSGLKCYSKPIIKEIK